MEILISSLVGGIAGLLISLIFEDTLMRLKAHIVNWFRIHFYHPRAPARSPGTFSLGNLATAWFVIDGDGEQCYTPETLKCRLEANPASLPPEIQGLRDEIEARQRQNKELGESAQWNGPLYALDRYAIGRTIPDENLEVTLTFRPTDYYTFLATIGSLDQELAGETLRKRYLAKQDLSYPIPFLANGFGVALVVFTGDRKILMTRRQHSTGMRQNELDVSVVEGVQPNLDRSSQHHGPDLYRTAIRGAQEELGLALVQEEITFLGFGVDTEFYQWNMLGVARTSETSKSVLEHRERGLSGGWENRKIELIENDPRAVFQTLKTEKIWNTGLVTLYWALVNEYGRKRVEAAIAETFSRIK